MATQNYSNHSHFPVNSNRYFPILLAIIFLGSVINIFEPLLLAGKLWALVLMALCLAIISMWYAIRIMVLRVQDRAIRAEENFRHFILTGKPLPMELKVGQIVALRFASDAEFPNLVNRALTEKLSRKAVKKAIKEWRPDLNRA